MVTLVAGKLEKQWLWEVCLLLKTNCIRQPERKLSSSSYNHNTLTTFTTSVRGSLQIHFKVTVRNFSASRWFLHRCSEGCQYIAVVRWTGQDVYWDLGAQIDWLNMQDFLHCSRNDTGRSCMCFQMFVCISIKAPVNYVACYGNVAYGLGTRLTKMWNECNWGVATRPICSLRALHPRLETTQEVYWGCDVVAWWSWAPRASMNCLEHSHLTWLL